MDGRKEVTREARLVPRDRETIRGATETKVFRKRLKLSTITVEWGLKSKWKMSTGFCNSDVTTDLCWSVYNGIMEAYSVKNINL